MPNTISLIAGLSNPGNEYAKTRHNAGAWLLEKLAAQYHETLKNESKFSAYTGKIQINEEDCRLLIPTTFMNLSGNAIKAVSNFFRIPAQNILVVHDELDLPVGTIRFKQGGGDGGHNGLRSCTSQLGSNQYWRLRIGIGHPGDRNRVHDYVLSKPSKADHDLIMDAIENAINVLPQFISGETQKAIQQLHS
jgi:PTH1 family peptidyl-tRNA hydrolase